MTIEKNRGNINGVISANNALGNLHQEIKDTVNAENYFNQSQEIAFNIYDNNELNNTLNQSNG